MIELMVERAKGAMLGLAVGDALGTTVEFLPHSTFKPLTTIIGGGPFNLIAGQWTDDTSMMLCLADSLIECGYSDPVDQIRRYVDWWRNGYNSSTGSCFDIGVTVSQALEKFEDTGVISGNSTANFSAGNGSLMRLAPIAIAYLRQSVDELLVAVADSSRTTHADPRCIEACQFMAFSIWNLLKSEQITPKTDKNEFLKEVVLQFYEVVKKEMLTSDIRSVLDECYLVKNEKLIKGTGFVVDSLEASLWAFSTSDTFEEGALKAANLGDDADTTAAIYGQLAGAFYGLSGIPKRWQKKVYWKSHIEGLALMLLAKHVDLLEPDQKLAEQYRNLNPKEVSNWLYYKFLLVPEFDWAAWSNDINIQQSLPKKISNYTLAQVMFYITALVSRERLVEGSLDYEIQQGTILALLQRIDQILS